MTYRNPKETLWSSIVVDSIFPEILTAVACFLYICYVLGMQIACQKRKSIGLSSLGGTVSEGKL